METQTFEEAFKAQIESTVLLDLTESELSETCQLSGEKFEPGDKILMVLVPIEEAGVDYKQMLVKKEVLTKKNWKYIPMPHYKYPNVARVALEKDLAL